MARTKAPCCDRDHLSPQDAYDHGHNMLVFQGFGPHFPLKWLILSSRLICMKKIERFCKTAILSGPCFCVPVSGN